MLLAIHVPSSPSNPAVYGYPVTLALAEAVHRLAGVASAVILNAQILDEGGIEDPVLREALADLRESAQELRRLVEVFRAL
jgi:hypothetical protein